MTDTEFLNHHDIEEWQGKRMRPHLEITLKEAATSLATDDPLVIAQPGLTSSRWITVNKATKKVAVLSHAGIWRWRSDIETGNYVPEGKTAPDGVPETRIQHTPSYKCEFSYAFDTSVDRTLWEYIRMFEDHVSSNKDFNRGKRPRRLWQDGINGPTDKYIVNAKVFLQCGKEDSRSIKIPYDVHPWLSPFMFQDSSPNPAYIPNPDRPKFYDSSNGVLRRLEDTNEPNFDRNDLIWMSFKLGFVVTGEHWWPEIIPIEFMRVGKVASQINFKGDSSLFPSLDDDYTPLELGEPIAPTDELVRGTKRKTRQSEEPESPTPLKKRATPDGDFIILDMEKLTVDPAVDTEKIAVDPVDETAKPVDPAGDPETNGKHKLRSKAAKDRTIARAV